MKFALKIDFKFPSFARLRNQGTAVGNSENFDMRSYGNSQAITKKGIFSGIMHKLQPHKHRVHHGGLDILTERLEQHKLKN